VSKQLGGVDWQSREPHFADVLLGDFYDLACVCRELAEAPPYPERVSGATWDLVADVCSLALDGSKTVRPFSPVVTNGTRRSFDVQDLSQEDLELLSAAVQHLTRPDIAARIHDVLWLRRHGPGIQHALSALDLYSNIPIDSSGYRLGLVQSWERAVTLARSLGKTTFETAQDLEAQLSHMLRSLTAEGDILALMLSRMMMRLRIALTEASDFADLMAVRGQSEPAKGPVGSLQFLECARDWYQTAGLSDRADDMSIVLAEAAVAEGIERASGASSSHMVAAHHLEKAIQQYRRTSHGYRKERALESRLAEIRRLHRDYSQRATEEFELIEGRSFDLTEIAEAAEASVKGKEALPALLNFIAVAPIPSAEQLTEMHRERLAEGSIADLFGRSIITNGGRVAYKVPALAEDSKEHVIASHVVTSHQMYIGGLVQGAIAPALRALSQEHSITKEVLYELCTESPAVPPGRETIFAMGLAAGFEWDFITSSHLVIPQIENFFRFHLKSQGTITTSLDQDGTETEKTLSPLLDLAKDCQLIDADIELAFRATLVDPRGSNLRNDLLHGLSEPHTANGAAGIYIWWLVLYIVLVPFWTRSSGEMDDSDSRLRP
jgi:hypothetical protein